MKPARWISEQMISASSPYVFFKDEQLSRVGNGVAVTNLSAREAAATTLLASELADDARGLSRATDKESAIS
jgi:hypothetical protein